jgi:hypothetical protein
MKHKFCTGFVFVLSLLIAACAQDGPTADHIPASLSDVTSADRQLHERLVETELQPADAVALAIAIEGLDPSSIPKDRTEPERMYEVGDVETFWVHNTDTLEFNEIEAELVIISPHAYFWQDLNSAAVNADGEPATAADWQVAADTFEASYTSVRDVFGTEESPGIDGDERVYIVHSDLLGRVGGYFGASHQLPRSVERYSNEGQFFFISNKGSGGIAADHYNEVLAHEYQHMVHENLDSNEDGWLDEGMSQLAQQIAGMTGDVSASKYTADVDQSLWYWGSDSVDYGHVYLFVDYLYEQFGTQFISDLAASQANGLGSIDEQLAVVNSGRTVDQVYADFITAAYFNDGSIAEGQYAFANANFENASPTDAFDALPVAYQGTVDQYGGADILYVEGAGQAMLTFVGSQSILLVPAVPHSGEFFWWGNRADASISTLTREVDLTGVDAATLTYWTWFNLEEHYDYAYVMVSTDGGETWTTQVSTSSRDDNPNDSNYGNGLTGPSGGSQPAKWVQETVDLSAYADRSILLRFAMIHDSSKNEHGFVVDDIEIPEIGLTDDVESGKGEWVAEGFILSHNRVPQVWAVRAAEQRSDGQTVIHDLDLKNGTATLDVDLDQLDSLVIFVIGQTRHTTMPAPYAVKVSSK